MEQLQNQISTISKNQLIIIGIILFIILVVLMLIIPRSRQESISTLPIQPTQAYPTVEPTIMERENQSPELAQAIAEQKAVQNEYVDWKDNNQADYPWINKMPLGTEKYYVYFDLEKKVFIARLYPAPGEDTEQLKTTVVNLLTEKGVTPNSFPIEWATF